jgi:hypothetical protein
LTERALLLIPSKLSTLEHCPDRVCQKDVLIGVVVELTVLDPSKLRTPR